MTELRNLPRNQDQSIKRTFKANGNKYTIRTAEESLSIVRLNEFQKWSMIVQSAEDSQAQYDNWSKAVKLADKAATGAGFSELSAFLYTQKENVLNLSKRKYDASMYLCTLFIIRENEDLRKWNTTLAEEKINDWVEANYSPFDFFLLCASAAPELTSMFKEIMETITEKQILESLEDGD